MVSIHRLSQVFAVQAWAFSSMAFATSEQAVGHSDRGFFVSIDGIQANDLRTYLAAKSGQEKGFKWVLNEAMEAERAFPIVTTLTAASHVSNLTCAAPAVHGVIANGFLSKGKKIDGFSAPVAAETFVEAAKRQGKKVISIGYASVDGKEERRSATWGISYPDAKYVSANQRISVDVNTLPDAQGWYLNDEVSEAQQLKESRLELELNPVTKERRQVNLLWVQAGSDYLLYLDSDKDLFNGYHAKLNINAQLSDYGNVFAYETDKTSPLFGYRRRIVLRAVIGEPGKVSLLVFGSSYNNAHPSSFREELDQASLVWPNRNTYYNNTDPVKYTEELAVIDNFLADVATFAQKKHRDADAVLFYQPLIDSVGHAFEGMLPRPFDPNGHSDPITQAYVKAYELVDANLSRVLEPATKQSTVTILGDHGMDAVKRMINVVGLLDVADRDEVQLFASGTLIMLYPKDTSKPSAAKSYEIGARLKEKLLAYGASSKGEVLGESYRRDTFGDSWHWGEATWVFTGAPSVWLNVAMNESNVEMTPYTWGMHGHALSHHDMATAFMIRGPHIKPQKIAGMSLIQAMPTFTKSIGISAPQHCQGLPLY